MEKLFSSITPNLVDRSSTPDPTMGVPSPIGKDVPTLGMTVEIYYEPGKAPEILRMKQGKGLGDVNETDQVSDELERRLMELKHTGSSRKHKSKSHKRRKTRKQRKH